MLMVVMVALLCISCNHDFEDVTVNRAEQIFGIKFNNDWSTVKSSSVTVHSQNMSKIQILAYIETDSLNKTTILNEIEGSPLVWVTSSQLCGNSTRGKRAQCGILDDYREPQEEDIVIISFPKEEEK